MKITIDFNSPAPIGAIDYQVGEWTHDYPRRLKITGVTESGERSKLLSVGGYLRINYLGSGDAWRIYLPGERFKSLILEQVGSDTFFDWSIAELSILTTRDS